MCSLCIVFFAHFATAHSCGLRRIETPIDGAEILFATAHSCGLRRVSATTHPVEKALPQRIRAGCDAVSSTPAVDASPLPQRIRAGCDAQGIKAVANDALCHSAFVRVATRTAASIRPSVSSLPQRIRAGCDEEEMQHVKCKCIFATAHSCGLRQSSLRCNPPQCFFATAHSCGLRRINKIEERLELHLCHSAFVRVATNSTHCLLTAQPTLPQRIRAGCDLSEKCPALRHDPLPQRIRAGCDALWDFIAMRKMNFATAHSCGLRLPDIYEKIRKSDLCHSAFVRVATSNFR